MQTMHQEEIAGNSRKACTALTIRPMTRRCAVSASHSERHHSLTQTVNVYDNNERPYPKVLELQTERTADAEGRGVGSCCLAWPSGQPGLS